MLSIVIPCYNEEERLPRTIEQIERYFEGKGVDYELILVDDGSSDGTRLVMDAAEGWLRGRGIEKLQLMVRADNSQVQTFYQSLGYLAQERIVYAKWLDGREPTP